MKTKTHLITSRLKNDLKNVTYDHTVRTDSMSINLCNNSNSEDHTDRTYASIETMYGDDISINQVAGWISVNGIKVYLKGKASK